MKFMKHLIPVASLALVFAINSKADLVIATPATSTFTALGASGSFDGTGAPFFNNVSDDNQNTRVECNIGALLSGQTAISQSNCKNVDSGAANQTLVTGDGIYEYLNDGSGLNVDTLKLESALGFGEITLQLELAGAKASNLFEIRKVSDDSAVVSFAGADDSGTIKGFASLAAGEQYYFWFSSPTSGISNSSTNAARFALFRSAGSGMNVVSFVLGIEDGTDMDYQDMVLSATVVPEPASVIALSGAVLGTLVLVRRRRQAKK